VGDGQKFEGKKKVGKKKKKRNRKKKETNPVKKWIPGGVLLRAVFTFAGGGR